MLKDVCAFAAMTLFLAAFTLVAFELTKLDNPPREIAAGTR